MKQITSAILLVVGFCIGAIIGALILAFPIMWLWNSCLVGLIGGVTEITSVWKAFGLLILCSLLFKSFHSTSNKS